LSIHLEVYKDGSLLLLSRNLHGGVVGRCSLQNVQLEFSSTIVLPTGSMGYYSAKKAPLPISPFLFCFGVVGGGGSYCAHD